MPRAPSAGGGEARHCGGRRATAVNMSEVVLKNVMKIYPNAPGDKKKKKAKKGEEPVEENKVNLQVTERGVVAVHDFNIDIADKEFIVLVGPSGCGKSTTLRMIAGLEEITEGEVIIDGKVVNDVAPKDRDIAMVFQNYALYPHMTVYDNMAFSLKLRHEDKETIDKKVREAAEILDITQYLDRKPKALSGGQRQRVAIGRAIVREPKVFLMDEPLSNLDAKLRNQMRAEIIKLRQRINTTFIYVTHDQTEAMTLGDRIVIMKDGFVQQIGTPQMNFFDAVLTRTGDKYTVTAYGTVFEPDEEKQAALLANNAQSGAVTLGVRPEHIMLCAPGAANSIKATVDVSEMMGSSIHLHTNVQGKDVVMVLATVDLPADHNTGFRYGEEVNFTFGGNVMHVFDSETGKALT